MSAHEKENMLIMDRNDLIEVLQMRFGAISSDIMDRINEIDQTDALGRLILAAANAPDFRVFIEELQAGEASYKLLGERFNPMSQPAGGMV